MTREPSEVLGEVVPLPRVHLAPPPSDEEITRGILAGHPEASVALYDRCHQAVERSVLRVLRSRDAEFEDLVQVSFEKILRSIHKRQYQGHFSLARWAASIATHATIDVLRARQKERKRVDEGVHADSVVSLFGGSFEKRVEARSEVEQVRRVLLKMPKKQVEAFLLHEVYGHELDQVAAVLGVSPAAAQSRALRGKKELLRRLSALPLGVDR
jgi:RNA polymerase sigma-70 factor (ECF subfamily)